MNKFLLVGFLALSFLSCSTDDDGSSSGVKDQILTGTVEGKAFTFVDGKAFDIESNNETLLSVYLTNVSVDCDDSILDFGLRISISVPKAVGVYNDINIVTKDGNNTPFNSLGETVEITSIDDTQISGKMKLTKAESVIAPESIFEGTFTVAICNE